MNYLKNTLILILGLFASLAMVSCSDNEDPFEEQLNRDRDIIAQYAAQNNLSGTTSGFGTFQATISPGNGRKISGSEIAEIFVRLSTLDNRVFYQDSTHVSQPSAGFFLPTVNFSLSGMIEAIVLMQETEEAVFLFPSSMMFGGSAFFYNGVTIASNQVIKADVTFKKIRTEDEQKLHEQTLLLSYLENTDLTGNILPDGVIHAIIEEGEGTETPAPNASVRVDYKGFFLNGRTFDEGENVLFALNSLIRGWVTGIGEMKRGEKALLLIPSHLAYGATGSGVISSFSPLLFEITLRDF